MRIQIKSVNRVYLGSLKNNQRIAVPKYNSIYIMYYLSRRLYLPYNQLPLYPYTRVDAVVVGKVRSTLYRGAL